MWGGMPSGGAGHYGGGGGPPGGGSGQHQKHDIFVGNLAFNTTEDQLQQAFSDIGKVINVRLVSDLDTGKPKGYAFIEFADPQAALSAIRNMNDYELNGRRLRVNFSNSGHLETLAGQLGMDLSQQTNRSGSSNQQGSNQGTVSAGTSAVAVALQKMPKAEMYDVVAEFKKIADSDPDEARRLLSGHPQLPEAMLYLMSKLDMIKTPLPSEAAVLPTMPVAAAPPPVAPARAADPRAAMRTDPRQAAAAAAAPVPAAPARVDPRQRVDPRAADPRRAAAAAAAPAAARPPYGGAPLPPPPPPSQGGPVDPNLARQVLELTPEQIAGLPADKQQSIMQLRRQLGRN